MAKKKDERRFIPQTDVGEELHDWIHEYRKPRGMTQKGVLIKALTDLMERSKKEKKK